MTQTKAPIETITVAASEARAHWSELVNRVANGEIRVIIEKNGAGVAALVSPDDLEAARRDERSRAEGTKAIEELSEAFKDIPDEEIEYQVAKALAEVREENRRRSGYHEHSSSSTRP